MNSKDLYFEKLTLSSLTPFDQSHIIDGKNFHSQVFRLDFLKAEIREFLD